MRRSEEEKAEEVFLSKLIGLLALALAFAMLVHGLIADKDCGRLIPAPPAVQKETV